MWYYLAVVGGAIAGFILACLFFVAHDENKGEHE